MAENVLQSLRGIGTTRLYSLIAVGVAVLGVLVFISLRFTSSVMAPLYSNVPVEDGAKIVAELEKQGIKYDLRANGTQIMVPADKVLKLRMDMAAQSLPSKGSIIGYEVFDKQESLGTPNFVYNVNLLRALEGELARTVATFEWVDTARVHLVMPKRELFSREKDKASASVVLKLRGGNQPNNEQVQAIRHLVASAVPELDIARITVVDSKGKLLSKGSDNPDDPSLAAEAADTFNVAYERRMERTIQELLENSIGKDKVKVQVAAEVNFDKMVTNSENFNPDEKVARSIQTSEEKSSSQDGMTKEVTVANNLPDAKNKGGNASSMNNAEKLEETTNFEISKTTQNHVRQGNTVDRISVAVLVDGTYVKDAEGKEVYTPRSAEELAQVTTLVKSAIGYSEKRGDKVDVINLPFAVPAEIVEVEKPFEWIKRDLDSILKTIVIGVVAIMAIMLIIRPLVNRAFEIAPAELEEGKLLLGGSELADSAGGLSFGGDDGDSLDIMVATGPAAVKKVSELAASNPEETIAVLRSWMIQKN